jgi:predicted ATPase
MEEAPRQQKIYRVCLTGGPCAGKTTALDLIREKLEPTYKVLVVPELATITILAGYDMGCHQAFNKKIQFTKVFGEQLIANENYFIELAKMTPEKDAVVVIDRGFLDSLAYLTKEEAEALRTQHNIDFSAIRDTRYDMVVHMVTAANGAAKYYTLANNKARSETPEQAVELDNRIKNAWNGHPNHIIVGNEKGFNDKINHVYNSISSLLEYPSEATYQIKYLIEGKYSMVNFPEDIKKEVYTEITTFIYQPQTEFDELHPNQKHISYIKLRKTAEGQMGYSYILRILSDKPDERIEKRSQISATEYLRLQKKADPRRYPINRLISVFVHNNNIFFLETVYIDGEKKFKLLRVNSNFKQETAVPSFLPVVRDVTNEDQYCSQNFCKKPVEVHLTA